MATLYSLPVKASSHQTKWQVLDEELAFVARCNEGGEFMAPEKLVQLEQIASRTWLRTLDDRIGLSHEEQTRKALTAAAPLPVRELLLADKAEHIISRQTNNQICPDNCWGFKLKVPQYIHNRGEIYNLSISRGTLTEEERYIINDHIVQTIIMLSQLSFPKHLNMCRKLPAAIMKKSMAVDTRNACDKMK